MTLSSRAITAVLMLAGVLCFARIAHAVEPAAMSNKQLFELVQQGREALVAEKPAEA